MCLHTQRSNSRKTQILLQPVIFLFCQDGTIFKHIVGLHSELYAVDSEGKLHGWAWSSSTPTPGPHPLTEHLQLQDERIKLIAGKFLRASVVTESGKVSWECHPMSAVSVVCLYVQLASWTDETVRGVAQRLELKVLASPELSGETLSQLYVSELVSAVVTESNKIFWW